MIKVLFVCHGNICRSPMAEFILKKLVADLGLSNFYDIQSAATSYEEIWNGVGNHMHISASRTLAEHNIPFDKSRRARHIELCDYDYFDLIIAMDKYNLRSMNNFFNGDPKHKFHLILEYASRPNDDVADPWYTDNFNATWNDLIVGCKGILKATADVI